jgi:lipopolysaccharide/colanic/teichoic acid biosynthesis glycosyltransferase
MLAETIFGFGAGAFIYHNVVYPLLLRVLARPRPLIAPSLAEDPPSIAIIMPAHNEEAFIARKIANLAALDYPRNRLSLIIVIDGCTDRTYRNAIAALESLDQPLNACFIRFEKNQGKIAALNAAMAATRAELLALTDVSAELPSMALRRGAAHFADRRVGVVCGTYQLMKPGSEGERAYWAYQRRIKSAEAALAAPMGAHGAFYMVRRALVEPLPADTINDDFILPMRIVARGYKAIYDEEINVQEIETATPIQDFRRRQRIGAGNLQQVLRSWRLADPRRPGLAFVFTSGKLLRAVMPFLIVLSIAAALVLAAKGAELFQALVGFGAVGGAFVLWAVLKRPQGLPKPLAWFVYLVEGYAAALIGSLRYLISRKRGSWSRAAYAPGHNRHVHYIPRSVWISKRALDLACGAAALIVLALVVIPVGLAIKLTSHGPIFYRQLRVGRQEPDFTHLFKLIKFRTMVVDAEAKTGPVWAAKNDPRVTPLGRFLRKTRIDELPQAINVLRGDMSVVGPRPERPGFFARLEREIPFYAERTYGLRPGITGLAQVNQDYDTSIEDVRTKLIYDHAYALRLSTWRGWLMADLSIILQTVWVMLRGKGQ